MPLLITGASGFVGGALLQRLAAEGRTGWAVSRRGNAAAPSTWIRAPREQVLEAGAGRTDRVECVIHLEVKHHVTSPSASDIVEFQRVNVEGTSRWLQWCESAGVDRFMLFSSIKAVRSDPVRKTLESAPATADAYYGASKWAAEQEVRRWAAADRRRRAVILRPAVVYGGGNAGNVGAMVAAIQRKRFFLVGSGENVKSMVSVDNLAAAVAHLLDRMPPATCEVYNIVDRESYSVRQIDAMIRAKLGRAGNSPTLPVALARVAAKFGDAFHRVSGRSFPINSTRLDALLEHTHFSCEKLLATGFQHPQTTEEGLGEMVDWYLKQA